MRTVSISDCIDIVASHMGVSRATILGRSKGNAAARPRQWAMWLSRTVRPDLSYPVIARAFERDHTTVLHAVRVIEELRGCSVDLAVLAGLLVSAAQKPASIPIPA